MALDTDITIPELPTSTSESNNDLILLTQPNAQAETGYSSAKATTETVAKKVVHGIEYETLLADFPQGKRNPTDALNELRNMVIGQFPIKTASGTIATFDTSLALPLVSLKSAIVPQQASGTSTPDNPLPISGSDEVVITHTYGDNITETQTITLPSTVYGGEVDVTAGKLRVTWGKYTITNDTVLSNFTPSSAYGSLARVSDIGIQAIDNSKVLTISNMAKGVSYDTRNAEPSIQRVYTDNEGYINIRASSSNNITNISALKTLFMGAEIIYMLATPIEIDLTPTTITTQGGTNNIWSDTGDVELQYRVGIQEYIDEQIASVQALVL